MKKGRLIVVEGTDGRGRTVQTRILAERLSKEGYKVQMMDFPQYSKSLSHFPPLRRRQMGGKKSNAQMAKRRKHNYIQSLCLLKYGSSRSEDQ